jgi:carboxypeptidase C (cathepsin A)
MPIRGSHFGVLMAVLVFCTCAFADVEGDAGGEGIEGQSKTDAVVFEDAFPPDESSSTQHVLKVQDLMLRYSATAGTLPIKVDDDGTECRIFFVSYRIQPETSTPRPLSFVFNGGPGASSAYLHVAAVGPKRVVFYDDGDFPGPPPSLADNIHTWLKFTDLVFVDPVGTGYSRCLRVQREQKNKQEGEAEAKVWGVREDLTALAKFIRLYLTRNERWLSPKFLMGESYGGFRVAALSDLLQSEFGIALNGIVLVSPALEFALLGGDDYSLLPWVVTLPSYAAVARYHGKASGRLEMEPGPRIALEDVERFALKEFLPALAEANTGAINSRLSSLIGLPPDRVARLQGRIPAAIFAKELLLEDRRLLSLYDGSWTTIDPDPSSPFPPRKDPRLTQLNTLLTPALNSYVREQLGYKTDVPYEVLSKEVSKKWNWRSGLSGAQGFVGVAESLKDSMSLNKDLKVLIAHGIFDLVTPYFGSVVVTRQMALDPSVAINLDFRVYDGGHMFYIHAAGLRGFFEDAKGFFESAVRVH